MTHSALDAEFAGFAAGGQAEVLRFYQTLAQTPLFLVLEAEAAGETAAPHILAPHVLAPNVLAPRVFELAAGPLLLAFDSEERLGTWAAEMGLGALPYATLPGRVIAAQMQGKALSLGLNFGAETAVILPPEAMVWLTEALAAPAPAHAAHIDAVLPLGPVPEGLLAALARGLAGAGGLAAEARLAAVRYQGGGLGHILGFWGAAPAAEPALTRAVAEALAFSGLEAGALDVTFLTDGSARAAQISALGHKVPLPPPELPPSPRREDRPAPGMNPAAPPKLF